MLLRLLLLRGPWTAPVAVWWAAICCCGAFMYLYMLCAYTYFDHRCNPSTQRKPDLPLPCVSSRSVERRTYSKTDLLPAPPPPLRPAAPPPSCPPPLAPTKSGPARRARVDGGMIGDPPTPQLPPPPLPAARPHSRRRRRPAPRLLSEPPPPATVIAAAVAC